MRDLFFELAERNPVEQREGLTREPSPEVSHWVNRLLEVEAAPIPRLCVEETLPKLRRGSVAASRYELGDCLGLGGYGEVYRARDRASGEEVAVKLVSAESELGTESGEWAVLRTLKVPGVVPLLDTHLDGDVRVLVMPIIHGTPFPGPRVAKGRRAEWKSIEPTVVALLETLERLHAAGFVHGDLKPSNVLVDAAGCSTVLDLGVAHRWRRPVHWGAASVCGTAEYAAPELFAGERSTPSADLFALGLMLYEALTGEVPAVRRTVGQGQSFREPFASLRKVAPELPTEVQRLTDALLGFSERPECASSALALLGRSTLEERVSEHLGWLGEHAHVNSMAHSLQAGRSRAVVGERQSGKTALLCEVERVLEARGTRVLRLRGEEESFARALCTSEEIVSLGAWENVFGLVEERLRHELRSGTVLLVDDFDIARDTDLHALIEEAKSAGGVLRVTTARESASECLAPLAAEELRECFDGPDVILHLREDAARALHERTGGLRGRVVRELTSWVRAGLASFSVAGKFSVTREAIDRLESCLFGPLRAPRGPASRFEEPKRRIIALAQLAESPVDAEFWEDLDPSLSLHLRRHLEELVDAGALSVDPEAGSYSVRERVPVAEVLSEAERERTHCRIADSLDEGDVRRVRHWVFGGKFVEAARESLTLGRGSLGEGRPAAAFSQLLEGVRNCPEGEVELLEQLLCGLTEAALSQDGGPALERVRLEVELSGLAEKPRQELAAVLDIAARVLARDAEDEFAWRQALARVESDRFRCWLGVLLSMWSRLLASDALHAAGVGLLQELAVSGNLTAKRELASAMGWYHSIYGRVGESIPLFRRALELSKEPHRLVAAQRSLAAALVEVGEFEEAIGLLAAARHLAVERRYSVQEARCCLLQKVIALRSHQGESFSPEEVFGMRTLGDPSLEAHFHLLEAARLYREGEGSALQEHAKRAARLFGEGSSGSLLSEALLAASRGPITPEAWSRCFGEALVLRAPGVRLQVIALLLAGQPPTMELTAEHKVIALRAVSEGVPLPELLRREVLSPAEARGLIQERIS